MEMIYAKMAQLGITAFVFSAGFEALNLTDNLIRLKIKPDFTGSEHLVPELQTTHETQTLLRKDKPTKLSSIPVAVPGSPFQPGKRAWMWLVTKPPPLPFPLVLSMLGIKDVSKRPVWQQIAIISCTDGFRFAKILMAGGAVAGFVSYAQHGRDSEKLFSFPENSAALGMATGMAGFLYSSTSSPLSRIATTGFSIFGGYAACEYLKAQQKR